MEIESPITPELKAVQAEYSDIMSNPQNPRHAAFRRGDPQVSAYIDDLYKKATPHNAPVPIATESLSVGLVEPKPGETPEAAEIRARNEVILAPLRQEWGPQYEARMATLPGIVTTLFEDMGEVYHELGARVRMQYGPRGEAAVLKLFAELHDIKQGG